MIRQVYVFPQCAVNMILVDEKILNVLIKGPNMAYLLLRSRISARFTRKF